jgi:hypothetical protein
MTLTADADLELAESILASIAEAETKRLGYAVTLTRQQVWLALNQARAIGEFPQLNS